ncbi:MAG: hypothetical protein IJE70_01500 [Oscillospiraceae bacterium]|nr:hypothetical protein [Oscillospiraceae bacterium]
MNKSIVSKEGKKRSGIRIIADSDTASSESIKRLIFSNRFKISFGITVQYEIGIGNGVIEDEIIKFRPLIHIVGNLVLDGNSINRNHAAIGEFQFNTAIIHVVGTRY